jgi:hypothetical protein
MRLKGCFFVHTIIIISVAILENDHCKNQDVSHLASEDIIEMNIRQKATDPAMITAIIQSLLFAIGVWYKDAIKILVRISLITTAIGVQLRHAGWAGCLTGDSDCCPNMDCPDTSYMNRNLTGCKGPVEVWWFNRNNYCPLPHWYLEVEGSPVADDICYPLYDTRNYDECYTWGCTADMMSLRHVANLVWSINAAYGAAVAL